MDEDPDHLVLRILDMRAFRRTWIAIEQPPAWDPTQGPMAARVKAAIAARVRRHAQRKGGQT